MFLHPAVMALLVCEILSVVVLVGACVLGLRIAAGWNITSTSAAQLGREKQAALVSAAVGVAMVFQVLSLFLLVEAADRMHPLFTGAMCAAGTLFANPFGYPALLVKIVAVVLCGIWLVLNQADGHSPHYPLLRLKFFALPAAVLASAAGGLLFFLYAARLDPEIITSCCGVLFDEDRGLLGDNLPRLGDRGAQIVFFAAMAWTLAAGGLCLKTRRGAALYGGSSLAMVAVSLAAVVSFISPCYYQLPTHHCPFCILQPAYMRSGYVLYGSVFAGGVCGAGAGALALAAGTKPMLAYTKNIEKRLCAVSIAAFGVVLVMAAWPLVFSDFRLGGY